MNIITYIIIIITIFIIIANWDIKIQEIRGGVR